MPLIVLEGIDKSGKGTQAKLLVTKLKMTGLGVECVAFPDYETPLGKLIRHFLIGKVEFCPEIRQLLYVANRWERRKDIDTWLREGKTVVADRYIPSGLAYGLANNLDLNWITSLEEGLPKPDLVIVIDAPVETSFRRSDKDRRDVYEKNRRFLENVRKIYLDLASKLGWVVVKGDTAIGTVHLEIWKNVLKWISK